MSLLPVLQAIVRDEMPSATAGLQLGVVTEVFSNSGGSGDHNLEVGVRIRGSALELQRVPVCASRPGMSSLPRVGDLVLVGFVAGELDGAIVIGVLHTDQVPSPEAEPGEVVYVVPDDDDSSTRRVHVELPNGNTLTVKDSLAQVTIGGTTLTLDGDKVAIEASGDIELTAGGNLKVEAGGDITMTAGGNHEVTAGAKSSTTAGANAEVTSPAVKLAGQIMFSAGC